MDARFEALVLAGCAVGCSALLWSSSRGHCLLCSWVAGEWIVREGKNGRCARADLWLERVVLDGQRIVNLLSNARNALIFNVCSSNYQGFAGEVVGVRVDFDRGGGGLTNALARIPLIHCADQNLLALPRALNRPVTGSSDLLPDRAKKRRGGAGWGGSADQPGTLMSKLVCPQCLMSNCIDCREPGCPGIRGFVPRSWQRPLHEITQDLDRYEALILKCDEHLAAPAMASNIALIIGREAQTIRAKQKKEAPAEPAPKQAAHDDTLTFRD